MTFTADHLTGAKTWFKPSETSTKLQQKNLNNSYKKCVQRNLDAMKVKPDLNDFYDYPASKWIMPILQLLRVRLYRISTAAENRLFLQIWLQPDFGF